MWEGGIANLVAIAGVCDIPLFLHLFCMVQCTLLMCRTLLVKDVKSLIPEMDGLQPNNILFLNRAIAYQMFAVARCFKRLLF